MNRVERALRRIAADLESSNQQWCLIGGLAVSARAEPRTTRDVDLMVAVAGDAEAEGLIFLLQGVGYRMSTVLQQTSTGRLATVRLFPPGEGERGALVDLLFASSSIEPEIVAAAEKLRILPHLTVPVARTGHLLALKVLAQDDVRRPQDAIDIRALLRDATAEDVLLARESLRLIETRGAHRGKDLIAHLERFLAETPSSP